MTERKVGQGQPRVRRVIHREGVDLKVVLASQAESDRKTQARLAAIERAGTFLVEHAGELDVLRAGRVEDRDAFNMDSGPALRDVTSALLDADVEVGAIYQRVQRGLLAQGSSDPNRMTAIARTFGEILAEDRQALVAERAEAAKPSVVRSPRS